MKSLIFLYLTLGFLCNSYAQETDVADKLKDIKTVDGIYNFINHLDLSKENLNFVLDLWKQDKDKYPDLPWKLISEDISRIAIASNLIQGRRQCLIDIDMDEPHDFVLAKSKSKDLSVKGRALSVIGLAGYESDIPYLASIVLDEQEGFAEGASLSIFFIGSSSALTSLDDLERKVKTEGLKNFLAHLIEDKKSPDKVFSMDCFKASRLDGT
ncbi:hypothetical protein [Methyloglobulus sp.]|uniref:hypothetical protein n=1 Tax=Methyloglobulus sp. TaxID=2518622 RepID=UPI00179F2514|nr:hypothetical protein [Methyloglobulus sp.]